MSRFTLTFMTLLALTATPLLAQTSQTPQSPPTVAQGTLPPIVEEQDAQQTRQQLADLLRQLPPNVAAVLRNDPSLANPDYLKAYPGLLGFIQRHPEVMRNPAYFFGTADFRENQPRDRAYMMFDDVVGGIGALVLIGTFVGVFTWLIRFFVDHRRWLRVTRTQTEVHTKLLDRLNNNEDLMSYMQSPAGRRFLESAPISLDDRAPRAIGAPMSRILLSVQAGVVLASLGTGFFFAQSQFPDDMGDGFYILGMLIGSLGIGFALSALAAYVISSRFGLVTPPRPTTTND
jgi:hypothetical protein